MLLLLLLLALFSPVYSITEISIITPEEVLANPISRNAVSDVRDLLQKACDCETTLNNRRAEIQLHLPAIMPEAEGKPSSFNVAVDFPYYHYPEHHYSWQSKEEDNSIVLQLTTPTHHGISMGLYGLLQEQLGFLFYHSKEMLIPRLAEWPLPIDFTWEARPRFDKKGFHLHTQHPLELTQPLSDVDFPNGLALIKEYIDWLARNQQNYFEFNLLESIDRKRWPAHAKEFVDYCHDRGVIAGVDISLHMVQQKAFMLWKGKPGSFRSKEKQIERNLEWLFQANWDVVNMEFSTTEFSQGNVEEKELLRLGIIEWMEKNTKAKLMGREHVVKEDAMALETKELGWQMSEDQKKIDQQRGVLVHTVMCYTMTEQKAPVYQNDNLRHMYDMLLDERQHRETWYYPESAYWITFDNSVPMTLLPYLTARHDDIMTCDSLKLPGHITFSSGWEWGYWLFDWSIARWSWEHTIDDEVQEVSPMSCVHDLFQNDEITGYINGIRVLQDNFLKEQSVMDYMTAMTITDEMFGPLNLQLHPRPKWSYKEIRNKVGAEVLDSVQRGGVIKLQTFDIHCMGMLKNLSDSASKLDKRRKAILDELTDGLLITSLRARHRSYTLQHILFERKKELDKDVELPAINWLEKAEAIRTEAMGIVKEREANYRYSLTYTARRFRSKTAYDYGYLYPVSYLHFWKREELQAEKNKFGPFYRSIWDVMRIIGLKN